MTAIYSVIGLPLFNEIRNGTAAYDEFSVVLLRSCLGYIRSNSPPTPKKVNK